MEDFFDLPITDDEVPLDHLEKQFFEFYVENWAGICLVKLNARPCLGFG